MCQSALANLSFDDKMSIPNVCYMWATLLHPSMLQIHRMPRLQVCNLQPATCNDQRATSSSVRDAERAVSVFFGAPPIGATVSLYKHASSMLIICASVAGLEPWQNPHVVAEGTEPAHALLPPFASEDAALAHARGMAADNSSMRSVSLDGTWRFHLHGGLPGRPSVQTPPFFSPLFDERGWFDLPVPSSWEMYGHSHAIYANVEYPFLEQVTSAGRYPSYSQAIESVEVPQEENPVGSFRRTFVLPQAWLQRLGEDGSCEESGVCWDVLLHFEAAGSSAMTVWLNGVRLGYAEDSKAAVEWRVPRSALRPGGRQLLAVEVLRWSDASYMESQVILEREDACRVCERRPCPRDASCCHHRRHCLTGAARAGYVEALWPVPFRAHTRASAIEHS